MWISILVFIGIIVFSFYISHLEKKGKKEKEEKEEKARSLRELIDGYSRIQEYKRQQEILLQRIKQTKDLAEKYPYATKYFLYKLSSITVYKIKDYNIKDHNFTKYEVDTLLSHSDEEYQIHEKALNSFYRDKLQKQKEEEERQKNERIESKIREEDTRRRNLAAKFKYSMLGDYKIAYCFDYYPKNRFPSVSFNDESNRKLVWRFKDGAYSSGLTYLKEFLYGNYTHDEMRTLTICVIPASTQHKNDIRFKPLFKAICDTFPLNNGYNLITIENDRTDSREHKIDNTIQNLKFSHLINGKRIILFDDITTRGTSFTQVANQLKQKGAISVIGFFLGKTYNL